MTSKVTYVGELRTEAEHIASGTTIITDAPVDNKGKGEMFSPTDLVATALASCALTIMGIAADTHGIHMTGTTCEVLKVMGTGPRRIIQVDITFQMKGQEFTDKQKQLLENAAKTCPVLYSLNADIAKNLIFNW